MDKQFISTSVASSDEIMAELQALFKQRRVYLAVNNDSVGGAIYPEHTNGVLGLVSIDYDASSWYNLPPKMRLPEQLKNWWRLSLSGSYQNPPTDKTIPKVFRYQGAPLRESGFMKWFADKVCQKPMSFMLTDATHLVVIIPGFRPGWIAQLHLNIDDIFAK